MSTIPLSSSVSGVTDTFASIPVTPTSTTKYTALIIGTVEAKPPVTVPPEQKTNFSDPVDQIAWEAFMRIEPRYSDANRKLAQ
jgi:hypothetical protein